MINQFCDKYRFLSNFWPCRIEYGGRVFPSVEHAYQASKFRDTTIIEAIQAVRSPGKAKRMAKFHQQLLDRSWEERKVTVMQELVRQKFQDPALARQLFDTGDQVLQEGNTWGDRLWGIDLGSGQGANTLGQILMAVRAELRKEACAR